MTEDKFCLAVTTYKKNKALEGWLNSIENFGRVGVIVVCDDDNEAALPVVQDFQARYIRNEFPFQVHYRTGERRGISGNKNRGIKFFLEDPAAKSFNMLVLSDDDLIWYKRPDVGLGYPETIGEHLYQAYKNTDMPHITGFLGGHNAPLSEDHMNSVFGAIREQGYRIVQENDWIYYYPMSQGMLLFMTRDLVEAAGYFDKFPGRYGFEHSAYSQRLMRLIGRSPKLFPILRDCDKYLKCANEPNNYIADYHENERYYTEKERETWLGINLITKNSGL